jgi:hypothetical protein
MILSDTFATKTPSEQNIELNAIISPWFSHLSDLECDYYHNPYEDKKAAALPEIQKYNTSIDNLKSELQEITISNELNETINILQMLDTFCKSVLAL